MAAHSSLPREQVGTHRAPAGVSLPGRGIGCSRRPPWWEWSPLPARAAATAPSPSLGKSPRANPPAGARGPWRRRQVPGALRARLAAPVRPRSPGTILFEGSLRCVASGRLPGDGRASLPPRRPGLPFKPRPARPPRARRSERGGRVLEPPDFTLPGRPQPARADQPRALANPQTKPNPNIQFFIKPETKAVSPQTWQRGFATVSSLPAWRGQGNPTPEPALHPQMTGVPNPSSNHYV